MTKQLLIKQVRSGCNSQRAHRETLRALGLRHHQAEVVKDDHPAIRGMIRKVRHLVEVAEVDSQTST